MSINGRRRNVKSLVVGTIRLGEKRATQGGGQRPVDLEYFNLKDAPEVAAVYGNEPKEIDIMLLGNDIEQIAPAWYKWYGGAVKDKEGNVVGGRLKCYGDGPDEKGAPGTAVYLDKKDPLTGIAPTRPCKGKACPDWNDSRGNQQCKQSMTIYCAIPRVSMADLYEVTTSSWRSISQILDMLDMAKQIRGGILHEATFKLCREEQVMLYTDKSGVQKQSVHSPIHLRNNFDFLEKHKDEIKTNILKLSAIKFSDFFVANQQELLEAPTGAAFTFEGDSIETPAQLAVATADSVVADPEVTELFVLLEKLLGKAFTPTARLVAVRKCEKEADIKAAVVAKLKEQINTVQLNTQMMPTATVPAAEPVPEASPDSIL